MKVGKRSISSTEDQRASNVQSKKSKTLTINEYNGWKVPSHNFTIPAIQMDETLTAHCFFEKYVSQRKPVVLRGNLPDDLSKLNSWRTSNDELKKLAGSQKVMVERRAGTSKRDTFGKGNEVPMLFSDFLGKMEKGDAMHYLTTQDVEANEDGQPDLMAPFMKTLSNHFPLQPKLTGHLIPQNINLWMGNNQKDGASSGLHHDYHDNLYIALRGRKRFRLYSPIDTENMYTKGVLFKVHPNGRINYEGDETTAYGADLQADAAAKASRAKDIAEQRLMDAEQAVLDGKPGAQEELEQAEEMLQAAMDDLIDAENDEAEEEDENDESGTDIFKLTEETYDGKFENFDDNDDFEDNDETKESSKSNSLDTGRRLVDKTVKNPDNFSKIEAHLFDDKEELAKRFPNILNAHAAFCELEAGDMLYLPASWFHEVTSFGTPDTIPSGKGLGHMAVNYWFHPPDNFDNFEHPYSTDFWPNDFRMRFQK